MMVLYMLAMYTSDNRHHTVRLTNFTKWIKAIGSKIQAVIPHHDTS